MGFLKKKSENSWLLLLILAFGLILRALNPTFGSPSLYISNDEAIAHLSALNMIANKTPASIANYTPLGAYIQIPFLVASFMAMKLLGLVKSVSGFELFLLTHEGYFLFIPRLISALFGTFTILVVYKLTLELFREKNAALIAASLTAVSFNLVHISHFGRPWTAALFFFVLAVYLAIKNKGLLSPIAIAFSYGFHQIAILAFPLIVLKILGGRFYGFIRGLFISSFLILLFSLLITRKDFLESIGNNQSFLLANRFLTDLIVGNGNLWESLLRTLSQNLSIYYTLNFLTTDAVIFLFGSAGLFLYFLKKGHHIEIFYYVVGYFIFASLFFHPLIRYLLPIFMLLIPFAANSVYDIFKKRTVLIILLISVSSINSLWWNWLFIQKPTFIQAHDWVNQNVAAEIPIYFTGGRFMTFAPNKQAIERVNAENADFKRRLYKILPDNYFDNVRNIIYINEFPGKNKLYQLKKASVGNGTGYIIDYYLDPSESIYYQSADDFELVKRFVPTSDGKVYNIAEPLFDASWNFETNDFSPKSSMYSLERIGPYFDILRVRNY